MVLTVFCLWLGWNVKVVQLRRTAMQEIREHGGFVFFKSTVEGPFEADGRTLISADFPMTWEPAIPFVRIVMGDRPVLMIQIQKKADLELVKRLFPESNLIDAATH